MSSYGYVVYKLLKHRKYKRSAKILWSGSIWFLRIVLRTFFVFLFVLCVLLGCLLFTDIGCSKVWQKLCEEVPIIKGDFVSGHFGKGFHINNFELSIPNSMKVEASTVNLDYELFSLFRGEITVRNLEVNDLILVIGDKPENMPALAQFLYDRLYEVESLKLQKRKKKDSTDYDFVRIRESKEDPTVDIAPIVTPSEKVVQEEPKNEVYSYEPVFPWVNIPVKINLAKVEVHSFLMLCDVIDVAVKDFFLEGSLVGNNVNVESLDAQYIDVQLHNERFSSETTGNADNTDTDNNTEIANNIEDADKTLEVENSQQETTQQENSIEELQKSPYDRDVIKRNIDRLAAVVMPIHINVVRAHLGNGRYHQDGYDTGVLDITFAGQYDESLIALKYFSAIHSLGHASLYSSSIDLRDYYPINVSKLEAFSNDKEAYFGYLGTHFLEANAKGDLVDLNVGAEIHGEVGAKVTFHSNVLANKLPFDLKATVKKAKWPLKHSDVIIDKVKVVADGNLDKIKVKLDTDNLTYLDCPTIDLGTSFVTNLSSVDVEKLDIVSDKKDKLNFVGKFAWNPIISFDGKVKGELKSLSYINPTLRGLIDFDFVSKANYTDLNNWDVNIPKLSVNGNINDYDLKMAAKTITANYSNEKINALIDDFVLENGPNIVNLKGNIRDYINLDMTYNISELSLISPSLGGNLTGNVHVGGIVKSPSIKVNTKSELLDCIGYQFHNLDLSMDGRLPNFEAKDINLLLKLEQLEEKQNTIFKNLELSLKGSESNHKLLMNATLLKSQQTSIAMRGSLKNNRTIYEGAVDKLSVKLPDLKVKLNNPMNYKLLFSNGFKAYLKEHSWSINGNILKLKDSEYISNTGYANTAFELNNLDVNRYRAYLPQDLVFSGLININGKLGLRNNKVQAKVEAKAEKQEISYNSNRVSINNWRVFIDILTDKAKAEIGFDFGKNGNIQTKLVVEDPLNKKNISGGLKIDNLQLSMLPVITHEVSSVKGSLNADVKFSGSLEKPKLHGSMVIDDTEILPLVDIGKITSVYSKIDFKGTKANIVSKFNLGAGTALINGDISWYPKIAGELTLSSNELAFNLLGYGKGTSVVDIKTTFSDTSQKIRGKVVIPHLRINVKDLPTSSVSPSKDAIEVYRQTDGHYEVHAEDDNLNMTLTVKIGDDAQIKAFGLRTKFTGDIKVSKRPNKDLRLVGTINLNDGIFKAYGQNLIIDSGKISFNGEPSNPSIDIIAIRNKDSIVDENITVGLAITGTGNNPRIKIFSQPVMSESEALSYLLRGKKLDNTDSGSSSMSTQLLLALGVMQTSSVFGNVGEAVGLEEFSVDSVGDGDDTQIEVLAQVTNKFQLAYGYGLYNSLSHFRARYQLFPRFYLEATKSVDMAVDAIYKFEFNW